MTTKSKVVVGRRYGGWFVIERCGNSKHGDVLWLCECKCGLHGKVTSYKLTSGRSTKCSDCGRSAYVHGDKGTKLYRLWCGMKKRCSLKSDIAYKYYGARGILVCDEWEGDYRNFKAWAMANGYKEGLTIDRIDCSGNYEPKNCQWLTRSENTKKMWLERRAS